MPLQRRLPKIGFVSRRRALTAELRVHELARFAGKTADLAVAAGRAGSCRKRAERVKRDRLGQARGGRDGRAA